MRQLKNKYLYFSVASVIATLAGGYITGKAFSNGYNQIPFLLIYAGVLLGLVEMSVISIRKFISSKDEYFSHIEVESKLGVKIVGTSAKLAMKEILIITYLDVSFSIRKENVEKVTIFSKLGKRELDVEQFIKEALTNDSN